MMTRLEAAKHFRKHHTIEVQVVGNELIWGAQHNFTCSIWDRTRAFGSKGRVAIFVSGPNLGGSCRGITNLQLLHFIKRYFPRKVVV